MDEFIKLEYENLANQRAEFIKQTNFTERSCVIIMGVIWGWLLTQKVQNEMLISIGYFIPLLINILGAIRVYGINKDMEKIVFYVQEIEKSNSSETEGWNTFYKRSKKRKSLLGISAYTYWIILLLASLILPLFLIFS